MHIWIAAYCRRVRNCAPRSKSLVLRRLHGQDSKQACEHVWGLGIRHRYGHAPPALASNSRCLARAAQSIFHFLGLHWLEFLSVIRRCYYSFLFQAWVESPCQGGTNPCFRNNFFFSSARLDSCKRPSGTHKHTPSCGGAPAKMLQ